MRSAKSSGSRGHGRREKSLARSLRAWLRMVETHRLTLGLFTAIVLTAITALHLVPDKVSLEIGEISTKEVRAPRAARYVDTAATERLRRQYIATVAPQYEVDAYATATAEAAVNHAFSRLETVRGQVAGQPLAERMHRVRAQLVDELGVPLTEESTEAALTVDKQTLDLLRGRARHLVLSTMQHPEGIREGTEDLRRAADSIAEAAAELALPAPQRDLVRAIAQHALRPTLAFSAEKTERARRQVSAMVKPVIAEILPGEPVIHKGETVTQAHLDKFTALGLRQPRLDWRGGIYLALLMTGIVGLIGAYLYRYHRPIYNDRRLLWLLALVVVGSLTAFKVGGSALGIKLDTTQYGYFGVLCISTASMLISVLLHPALAVVVAALFSLHVGIMASFDLRFAGVALFSSLVGIHGFSRIRDRGDLVRTLLALCLANSLAIWVLGSIGGDTLQNLVTGVAWGIGSSVLSCLVTWLGVALLERPFGITTHIGLLELSDMNRPLLRRLLQESPGTYIHSLNVGQLAEAAAEAIGADALLARVGAYYHDIGKVMRPYCFVENQTLENIHNRLNPTLSTLVVTSHIKDGVELAREYRLPGVIQEIIRSHHGTGLVKYFYHQAMLASEGDHRVPEEQFRYEGPRPRTKEAGIIMLADSVEGAVRSSLMERPDPARIQAIVTRIIKEKTGDGQLDECDLTFRDLTKIGVTFTRILQGMFHSRIKYPEPLTPEGQKLDAIDNGHGSPAEHPAIPFDEVGDRADHREAAGT
ncbi:MAG TPA: HDIG domain-containing protein [Armatimonadota bacterium]|nr:HDIG domain-containing protein [Armatimonadota bacterium]